jgi:hypothetical protein
VTADAGYESEENYSWFEAKVLTEILLAAMACNVNKLHAKIQQKSTGKQLFGKLLA